MVRGMVSLGLALAIDVCAAGSVAAHGSPPDVTQISMRDAHDVLVATSRGMIFGDPDAHRWALLCSEAFGVSVGGSYRVARLPSGRLFVSNVRGLRTSDDQGCTWQPHPVFGELDVTNLFQETTRRDHLYLTVFDEAQGGIHASEDGGDTFQRLYGTDASEFLTSVEVARGEPTRLYATLTTTEELPRMFVLRSEDAGATWARTELPDAAEYIDARLLGVSPTDADELFLRVRYIDARNGDGLLHSRDGGLTFALLGKFGPVSDVAFGEDGTSFVVAAGRVMRATPDGLSAPIEAIDGMTFGELHDQQLLLSGYRVVDDRLNVVVWSSDVASTGPLRRWMGFDEVTSLAACPADSPVSVSCERDWLDWNTDFLTPPAHRRRNSPRPGVRDRRAEASRSRAPGRKGAPTRAGGSGSVRRQPCARARAAADGPCGRASPRGRGRSPPRARPARGEGCCRSTRRSAPFAARPGASAAGTRASAAAPRAPATPPRPQPPRALVERRNARLLPPYDSARRDD